MPTPLVLVLTTENRTLQAQLHSGMSLNAFVRDVPGPHDLQLIIHPIGKGSEYMINAVSVVGFLMMLREQHRREGKVSGIAVAAPGETALPLEQTNELFLRRLLDVAPR